jgi:hypothetical protein
MELHHGRLVLRANRAQDELLAVPAPPGLHVLSRIRADRGLRQVTFRRRRGLEDHARVDGHQGMGPHDERIHVHLPDPRLFQHQLAEPHEHPLERREVRRGSAAHALERLEDPGPLHQAPRERGGERGQADRPVPHHLDQLAAGAEQDYRPELAVDAAAEDQLVGVAAIDHGLNRDAAEVLGAGQAGDRLAYRLEGGRDLPSAAQIEAHPSDLGLVGDGAGQELHHHRKAQGLGRRNRLLP